MIYRIQIAHFIYFFVCGGVGMYTHEECCNYTHGHNFHLYGLCQHHRAREEANFVCFSKKYSGCALHSLHDFLKWISWPTKFFFFCFVGKMPRPSVSLLGNKSWNICKYDPRFFGNRRFVQTFTSPASRLLHEWWWGTGQVLIGWPPTTANIWEQTDPLRI